MAVSNQMTITIKGDASSLQSALKMSESQLKQFGTNAENIGTSSSNAFDKLKGVLLTIGGAAVIGKVVSGIKNIVAASVEAYGSYEQLIGGVETLFKDSADIVEQYADNAYKTAGLSANQYMEQATSFSARLLQGLGGDTKKAAEYANVAITDMADNANKMGTSIEMIQNAYQGFAKQNYTMLDNLKLGYGGTATEMARLINDSGVLGDTMTVTANNVNEISFDTMIEAIHTIQEEMGITGTTALEAEGTIQGSIASVKGAWQNLLVGLGDQNADMTTLMGNLVTQVGVAANNLIPVIKQALIGLGTLLKEMLPEIMNIIVEFLSDPEFYKLIFNLAVELFFALVKAIPQILGALLQAMGSLVGSVWDWIKGKFGEFAASFGNFLGDIFKGAINGVISFIEGFINAPIDILNRFIGIINGAFGFIGVNLGYISRLSLPRLEQGGIIPGNSYYGDKQLARVNSGEMVINRQQQAMLWDAISTGNYETSNTVGDIYINVDATGQSNPEGIAVEIAKAMKKAFDNQGIKPNLAYAGSLR